MKKKISSIVLSAAFAALMLFSLAACDGGGDKTTPVGDMNASKPQQQTAKAATIEETVMWDNDDKKITVIIFST